VRKWVRSKKTNSAGHIESILVRRQLDVSLLSSVRSVKATRDMSAGRTGKHFDFYVHSPDQCSDLFCVDFVQLLDGCLDLSLVGRSVDNEYQCVNLFDLLHGRLGVEGK
jgi:hypothetical protein